MESVLDILVESPAFAAALSIVGIVLAVNGGRIAAHRSFSTRLFKARGWGAVALGLTLLVLGLAVLATSWIRGLRLL